MSARWIIRLVVVLSWVVVGCSDDAADGATHLADAGDSGRDALEEGDGGADGGEHDTDDAFEAPPFSCPEPPAIQIAGTPRTDALAQNPAQCGQPEFSWLTDASTGGPAAALGELSEVGVKLDFPTDFIELAIAELGASAPREVAHDIRITQFTYTTQDRGELIDASAMIAYPDDAEVADQPHDIILLLHGTSGFTDACAATKDFAYQGLAAVIASFGYVVVAPDYIGLKAIGEPTGFLHPYLVGQPTAIASIDAVRAAMRLPANLRGNLCLSPRVITVGGSQGGHAALWVDRLAPYYARELEFAGAVATVPPADMLAEMNRALKDLVKATANTVAFYGASAGWYGYADRLDEVLVPPLDTDVPAALGAGCDFEDALPDPEAVSDIFQQTLIDAALADDIAGVEPWGCMTGENGLTSTSVARIEPESDAYGILYVLGENDELVHTPIERESFEALCDAGLKMEYLECAGARHGETTLLALPQILDFVDARLAGEVFDSPTLCQVSAPVTCDGGQ